MTRRLVLAIIMVLLVLTFSTAAGAQVIEGTDNGDVLIGTEFGDKMYGYGAADTLRGKGGGDTMYGGSGEDSLECDGGRDEPIGGRDDDLIFCNQADGKPDVIDCGSNTSAGSYGDTAFWWVEGTVVFTNCEHSIRVQAGSALEARLLSRLSRNAVSTLPLH